MQGWVEESSRFASDCHGGYSNLRIRGSASVSTARGAQSSAAAIRCDHCHAVRYLPQLSQMTHFSSKPQRDTTDARLKKGRITMNETLASWTPRALSVLRIITGLLIIQHGMGKLLGFPANPAYANLQLMSLVGAAGLIELIGGALLILGLFTQAAAFILAGEMAFAYFIGHYPRGFHPLINGGTLAALYCFTCLYLSTAGAGPWSVDASMKKA
jgi:putative oxidoreductase